MKFSILLIQSRDRGGPRGGLGGAIAPRQSIRSTSEGEKQFVRRFFAFKVP